MSQNISFGKLEFFAQAKQSRRLDPESPFRLVIFGDYTARATRGVIEPIASRRVWKIDCDNFEQVVGKLAPKLSVRLENAAQTLAFQSLADFHPHQILPRVPKLAKMVEQRQRLANPATAAAAATELGNLLARRPTPEADAPVLTPTTSASESNEQTIARLLGGATAAAAAAPAPKPESGVQRLIEKIVSPSIVPGLTPEQTALLSTLDLDLSAQLRSILHDPNFQALESTWRGLDLLVRTFGGEENLKLQLLDISREELAADLNANEDLQASGLFKLLTQQADEEPWTLCLGQYAFSDSIADLTVLGRLAKLFGQADVPLVCEGHPSLMGCDGFDKAPRPEDWTRQRSADAGEAWRALRELPEATHLGLALPRFLLRQPYGQQSDAIDSFPFEEMAGEPRHENYLWGNPALLCGYVLAEAFQAEGWDMQTGGYAEVGDLPVHQFKSDDEITIKPCAEAWLSDRAGERIADSGLIAVLSIKGRDAVKLPRLQSLRQTPLMSDH